MKLSPIDIEQALELSAAAAPPEVKPLPPVFIGFDLGKEGAAIDAITASMIMREHMLANDRHRRAEMRQTEADLTRALQMLGRDGEYWIKGEARKVLGVPKLMRRLVPFNRLASMSSFVGDNALKGHDEPIVCQTELYTVPNVAYCTVGVMGEVSGTIEGDARDHRMARMLEVFEEANRLGVDIPTWNDNLRRTFADVRTAFEKAILYARHRAQS